VENMPAIFMMTIARNLKIRSHPKIEDS